MRATSAIAALVLGASVLTGCGGGDGEGSDDASSYCDDLKSAKEDFSALDGSNPDVGALDKAFDTMHQLADEAPEEVSDDWKVLDGAITDLTDALEEAGITMDDLAKMQSGEMPEGLDPAKLQELAPKMQELADQDFQEAADAIEKHAKDECDVDLSESSS